MKTKFKINFLEIAIVSGLLFFCACGKESIAPESGLDQQVMNEQDLHHYVGPPAYNPDSIGYADDIPRKFPAPGNIKIGMITFNSARVAWDSVHGAVSYNVEYEESTITTPSVEMRVNSTNYQIKGIKPQTNYECRVQTIGADGISNYSPWQEFRTGKMILIKDSALYLNLSK